MLRARRRELGAMLRTARDDRRYSVHALATYADVSPQKVVRLEAGQIEEPKITDLARLADALGLPLPSLLDVAGVPLHRYLPDLTSYLRQRHPELPREVIKSVQAHFDEVSHPYLHGGPAPGEDEGASTVPPGGSA